MHIGELTAPEQRVLGCLIEKRWTTPDQYPLSLNALRLACNQSTNRDPVTDYDEAAVREAAQRLSRYGLARLASRHGSRAIKYRHLAEEALGLDRDALALLAVMLLRGPQTPGELKSRSERMASLGSIADVERVLATLTERGYARRLGRRPGQKEDRFEHLLGPETQAEAPPAAMEIEQAITSRRTHKAFGPEPVPRDLLDQLLGLARWAPNHKLTNPWRLRVIGAAALARLKQAAGPESAPKLDRAPTLVVATQIRAEDPVQDQEDLCATACAVYAVLLAAHGRGLAGYWRTPEVLRTREGLEAVGVPVNERFVSLIHLGWPRQEKEPPVRLPPADFVTYLD